MSNKICCVPGCPNSIGAGMTLHKFPNPSKDKDLFNKWVFCIGGDICGVENDHIFKYRRVCRAHFEPKYWCRNNRLSNIAVPTKNMTGQSNDISSTNSPGPPASLEPKYTDMEHMEAECSETESAGNKICEEIETETVDDITTAPTAFEFVSTTVPPPSKPFRAGIPVVASTNACSMIDASTQTEILDDVQLMTTQISRMKQEIKDLRKELRRSKICIWKRNKRIFFLKGRLDTSRKNFNQNILEKVTKKMTPAAKVFTTMQYTQTSRRNKGRRFNHEEKVLSMSMYKSSPTGYALLSNIFTLPSVGVINKYCTEVQNELRISEEFNSINQLDHTTCHGDDDATESPVTHTDNDDTFVPDVDFNQLDYVIGDDNDNM